MPLYISLKLHFWLDAIVPAFQTTFFLIGCPCSCLLNYIFDWVPLQLPYKPHLWLDALVDTFKATFLIGCPPLICVPWRYSMSESSSHSLCPSLIHSEAVRKQLTLRALLQRYDRRLPDQEATAHYWSYRFGRISQKSFCWASLRRPLKDLQVNC